MIRKLKKRMERRREFIEMEEVSQRIKARRNSYTPTRRMVNIVLGCVMVGVGLVTLPFPTGSVFIILVGLFVMSSPFSIVKLLGGVWDDVKVWWSFLW